MFRIKRILSVIAVLVLLVIITPNFLNINNYKNQISRKLFEITNYHLIIDGDIKIFFLPSFQIRIKNAKLMRDLKDEIELVSFEDLSANISLLKLLTKTLKINEITVNKPKINIGCTKKIANNINQIVRINYNTENKIDKKYLYDFNKIQINDGELNYKLNENKLLLINHINLEAKPHSKNSDINISFQNNGMKSNIELKLSSIYQLFEKKIDNDFIANISLYENDYLKIFSANIKGNLKNDLDKYLIKSDIQVADSDLSKLFAHKIYKENRNFLPKISLINNHVKHTNQMHNIDAHIKLTAKNIIYNSVILDEINSDIKLRDNNLYAVQNSIRIADGEAQSTLSIKDFVSDNPMIHYDFKGQNISLNKLFKNNIMNSIIGKSSIDFILTSMGPDKNSIISNTNASGSFAVDKGEIINLPNQFKEILNIIAHENIDSIVFDHIKGDFKINHGIIHNNLSIFSKIASISGTGTLNLKNDDIDFRITPENILHHSNIDGLSLGISGKFYEPKYNVKADKNVINNILERISKKKPKLKNFLENNLNKALELIK